MIPARPARRRSTRPEYHLQVAIAAFLRVAMPTGVSWTAFPAGELRTAATGRKLKLMGLQKGWPDILVVMPTGKIGGIELKAPGGSNATPEQAEWGERVTQAGGYFAVCRSVEDVEAALTAWLDPLGHRLRTSVINTRSAA